MKYDLNSNCKTHKMLERKGHMLQYFNMKNQEHKMMVPNYKIFFTMNLYGVMGSRFIGHYICPMTYSKQSPLTLQGSH
jgi:hypothetical protein